MKKTILHIIHNLGRGGAETMLVKVVKELPEYNNIIVTLFPQNHFGEELKCDRYYSLNLRGIFELPLAISRLKKIIRENKVDIVHSHLLWPTVLARLATPRRIPLVTTIHAFIASSVEYKIPYIRWIDKITYRVRPSAIITVAKGALDEYFSFLKLKRWKAYALHTFVDTRIFQPAEGNGHAPNGVFRIVSVGALRKQKNHAYLVDAFRKLDNSQYQLDIYGQGPLGKELAGEIEEGKLNIHLKGEVKNVEQIIPQYDLFVMSSTFEGFSLSVLEAMAMKVPLLVSDIASFREQCGDTAQYFDLDNIQDFTKTLEALKNDRGRLKGMSEAARDRAINNFTLAHHMQGLRKIYAEVLES